jgi:hypothetical protein
LDAGTLRRTSMPAMNKTMMWVLAATSGVLLALMIFIAWIYVRQQSPMTREQLHEKYIREYTKREQVERGVDCSKLKLELREFLETQIRPIVESRKSGQNWNALVKQETKTRLDYYREAIFTCMLLYKAGDNGSLNELKGLDYAVQLGRPFFTMDSLLQIGGSKANCDATCLDRQFAELDKSYKEILGKVK